MTYKTSAHIAIVALHIYVPKQQTAHLTVFHFCIMVGVFGDYFVCFMY